MAIDSGPTEEARLERSRADIETRLRTTIAAWKAEVTGAHEGLADQIQTANRQLGRLLEILATRNDHAMALAAAKNEVERLRQALSDSVAAPGMITQYADALSPAVESIRREMSGTFERLTATIATWTAEVSRAQEGLAGQIQESNRELDTLLGLLGAAPEYPEAGAPSPLGELVRQQEHTIVALREDNAALRNEITSLKPSAPKDSEEYRQAAEALALADAEIVALNARVDALETELAYQTQHAGTLNTERRESIEALLADLEAAAVSLLDARKTPPGALHSAVEAVAAHVEAEREAMARATAAENALADANARLGEITSALEKAHERAALVDAFAADMNVLEARIAELDSAREQQAALLLERDADIAHTRQRIEELEAALGQAHEHAALADAFAADKNVLEARIAGLESDLAQARTLATQAEHAIAEKRALASRMDQIEILLTERGREIEERASEVTALFDQIATLETTLAEAWASGAESDSVPEEFAELPKRVTELESVLAERNDALSARDIEFAALSERFDLQTREAKVARERLEQDVDTLQNALAQNEAILNDARDARATAEHELNALHVEMEAERTALAEARATIARESAEKNVLMRRVAELTAEEESVKARMLVVQSARQAADAALADAQEDLRRAEDDAAQRQALECRIIDLSEAIEQLEARLEEELSAHLRAQHEREELRASLDARQAELASAQEALQQRAADTSAREQRISELNEAIEQLEARLEEEHSAHLRAQHEREELRASLDARKAELASAQEALQQREADATAMERDLAALHVSLKSAENLLAEEREARRTLETELDTARSRCEALQSKSTRDLEELENLRREHQHEQTRTQEVSETLRELRSELAVLEEKHDEATRAYDALREDLADSREAAQSSEMLIAELSESVEAQHRLLRERDQERDALRSAELATAKSLEEARAQETMLRRRIEAVEAERDRLEEDLRVRALTLDESRAANLAQQEALAEREARLAALESASGTTHAREEDLRNTVAEARAALDALREEFAAREADLKAAHDRLAVFDTERANGLDPVDLAAREHEMNALRDELVQLREASADAAAESAANREEMKRAMAEMGKAIYERDQAMESLRALKTERGRMHAGSIGMGLDAASAAADRAARNHRESVLLSELLQDESRHALGEILVNAGVITEGQLREALKLKKKSKELLLGTALLELEYATEDDIAQAIACQMRLPLVTLGESTIDRNATALLHKELCTWHVCIPMRASQDQIVLAMANPLDDSAVRKVSDLTRRLVKPVVATPSHILSAIDEIYGIF